MQNLENQMEALQAEEEKSRCSKEQLAAIKAAVEQELSFSSGINFSLVTTILDHIVVRRESTKENICLDIHLKFGAPWEAAFQRENTFRYPGARRYCRGVGRKYVFCKPDNQSNSRSYFSTSISAEPPASKVMASALCSV